jgi:hypothetical protein
MRTLINALACVLTNKKGNDNYHKEVQDKQWRFGNTQGGLSNNRRHFSSCWQSRKILVGDWQQYRGPGGTLLPQVPF